MKPCRDCQHVVSDDAPFCPSCGAPRPAKPTSIGQFASGVVTIAQFGFGVVCVSQFSIAAYAVTQIGLAYSLIAQIGLYVDQGYGQLVRSVFDLF